MQVVRRARTDDGAGTDSHHVAGRHDAQGRYRRRHTNATPALWDADAGGRASQLAGRLPGAVAESAPERAAAVEAGESHRRRAVSSPDGRVAASRHKESPRRIPAEERRSL